MVIMGAVLRVCKGVQEVCRLKGLKCTKPLILLGFVVVPEEGLEPSHTRVRQILSLLQTPFYKGFIKSW